MQPDSPATARTEQRCNFSLPVALSVIALAWITSAQAHSPVDPAGIADGHPTGHVRDHADVTWPPQPRGMQDAMLLSNPGSDTLAAQLREQRAAALERIALARVQVRQALGGRFARVGVAEDEDKVRTPTTSRLVYFSHARNSTVELLLDGQTVRSITSTPAAVYQPEITEQEASQAEGIARAYFASVGESGVEQLQAFGILAYQPSGTGFFDTRVLYISFHRNSDAPPEYAAWVDLTRQTVLRTRKEQP